MDVKITDSKFVYSGKSYFRGGCEDINLVSFGEKRRPSASPPICMWRAPWLPRISAKRK